MAADEDFAAHPELVRGYIGPAAVGPNSPARRVEVGEDGREILTGSVCYLLDPRVVDGTSWVTGANEPRKHVLHLVKGRDFSADGSDIPSYYGLRCDSKHQKPPCRHRGRAGEMTSVNIR